VERLAVCRSIKEIGKLVRIISISFIANIAN